MSSSSERVFTFRFALVVTAGLCYFMALGILLPVVPVFVKHDLGGNDIAVGVVVGAFAVGAVLIRPFTGRLGDRVGRRILIVVGGVIVGSAGLLYLLASSVVPLVLVRVLGGIGEAAFFVGAASMITDLAPESRRGEAISYWSIAVYGGLAFGPLLGNLLLGDDHFDRVWLTSATLAFVAGAIGLFTRDVMTFDPAARDAPRPSAHQPRRDRSGHGALPRAHGACGVHRVRPALRQGDRDEQLERRVPALRRADPRGALARCPRARSHRSREGRDHRDSHVGRWALDHGVSRRAGGLVRGHGRLLDRDVVPVSGDADARADRARRQRARLRSRHGQQLLRRCRRGSVRCSSVWLPRSPAIAARSWPARCSESPRSCCFARPTSRAPTRRSTLPPRRSPAGRSSPTSPDSASFRAQTGHAVSALDALCRASRTVD